MEEKKVLEIMELFEVEELEERLEFAKWTAKCKVENNPKTGTTVSGEVCVTFGK